MTKRVDVHTNMRLRVKAICLVLLISLAVDPMPAAASSPASGGTHTVEISGVRHAIDFTYLKKAAPNSVAWLYQPNTTINDPVMYSENATYYLKRQFNDLLSTNGSLYMTGETPDFSAPSITIYGRNCLDNTMLGILSNYREDDYYKANPTLYLLTPEGDYQLDIFAGIRTQLSDNSLWQVSQRSTAGLVAIDLPAILEKSFIKPIASNLPDKDDKWAVLATESNQKQGSRYVIYARKRPIVYGEAKAAYVNEIEMDSRETLNKRVKVDGVGEWMLYAQNDAIWSKLVFEVQDSSRRRPFGDGGCGPTAIAIALANMVDKDELTKLGLFAESPLGFRFCSCSVNDYHCRTSHLPYQLTTPDEYARYLPLAVASFATGNNIWGVLGRVDGYGTSMGYLEKICAIFGISFTQTNSIEETLNFLKGDNTIAISCTSGYNSPFTHSSHFLVIAGADDEYLYLLDPLRREKYKEWDKYKLLEVLEPGLIRMKHENTNNGALRPIYLLHKQTEPADGV